MAASWGDDWTSDPFHVGCAISIKVTTNTDVWGNVVREEEKVFVLKVDFMRDSVERGFSRADAILLWAVLLDDPSVEKVWFPDGMVEMRGRVATTRSRVERAVLPGRMADTLGYGPN